MEMMYVPDRFVERFRLTISELRTKELRGQLREVKDKDERTNKEKSNKKENKKKEEELTHTLREALSCVAEKTLREALSCVAEKRTERRMGAGNRLVRNWMGMNHSGSPP